MKIAITCLNCGGIFYVYPIRKNAKFCKPECYGNYVRGKTYEELFGKERAALKRKNVSEGAKRAHIKRKENGE